MIMFRKMFTRAALVAAVALSLVLPAAASVQFSTAVRNGMMDAITSNIGTSGLLRIYSGTAPANVGTAISTQTLLVELPCSATFAPSASGGVLTLNSITQTNATATGTASFFRFTTSGGTAHIQGTVGTSGADLNLINTSIASGQPISITSFTFTAPGV
jgi:hypothetical protein